MAAEEDVYCTLVMSDTYLPGAAVLAHSLRDGGTKKKLACMVSQDSLRASTVNELQSLYNYVIPIERIGNPSPANLYLMNRPDLLYTFTKINLWRLTQFRKIIYVDSDVVALRAPDELFDVQEDFAAAPDVGWPDAFNTGVMVVAPHMGDYWALRTLAGAGDSFDGADQGLLNQYYEHRPWKRLSFTYNCTPSANYQYEPAYRYYKRDISMVHFIGSDKPWQQGRDVKAAPGAYQEMLSRWWAVYDRHFKASTRDYISTAQGEPMSYVVQRGVKGEMESRDHGYYATGYPAEGTKPAPPPPEASAKTTEAPFTEPIVQAEQIDQGLVEPTPTVEQRKFSAPHMEWDATRAAPPPESRPEAAHFPIETYEFSRSNEPFRPPPSYPEPPKDMWYQFPKDKPKKEERLAPIFPWEERELPKPARRFVEDEPPPSSEPELEEEQVGGLDELEVQAEEKLEPTIPAIQLHDATPWHSFGAVKKNAWDEVSGIEDYVHALTAFQRSAGKVQVLHQTTSALRQEHILSPSNEPKPEELIEKVRERRESLILTDFPSAVERPSLPVTPAPRRRPTFWGIERNQEGELPPAEGVPDQAEWDPEVQLEQLRRNSLIGPADLKLPPKKSIPCREMPSTSAAISDEVLGHPHPPTQTYAPAVGGGSSRPGVDKPPRPAADAAEKTAAKAAPTFIEPVFDAPTSSSGTVRQEAVLSPTNTQEEDVAP